MFEHRNFIARYQRETNHITVARDAPLVTMDASLQYWLKHPYILKTNKNTTYAKNRSKRDVRKEINYSKPCSNAPDKAQLRLSCTHLSTSSLRSLVHKLVQPNSTVLYLGYLSTVRNNLFHAKCLFTNCHKLLHVP